MRLIVCCVVGSLVSAGHLAAQVIVRGPLIGAQPEVKINFQPADQPPPTGWLVSDGSVYTAERGFGWEEDTTGGIRRRKVQAEPTLDTLVAIRTERPSATFRLDLDPGNYLVTVSVGDPAYSSSTIIRLQGEEQPWVDESLARDQFRQFTRPLELKAGPLRLTVTHGNSAGCINYLIVRRVSPDDREWQQAMAAWAKEEARRNEAARQREREIAAKEVQRQREQSDYRGFSARAGTWDRQVFDLSGRWLFIPAQGLQPGALAETMADRDWHLLPVPDFWNQVSWWLYGGPRNSSTEYVERERRRVQSYTFDSADTGDGWYHHWLSLPREWAGRQIRIRFDGVASLARVYLNGVLVGEHVGMFAPFECDLTRAARPGQSNLLAVYVSSAEPSLAGDPDQVVTVAVTVPVTRRMLAGLPHGMYGALGARSSRRLGGIWQPVTLIVTPQAHVEEVWFQPSLEGGRIETKLTNQGTAAVEARLSHRFIDDASGKTLPSSELAQTVQLAPGEERTVVIEARGLYPTLWTPEHPHLYRLVTTLVANGAEDRTETVVGFRTFQVQGNHFLLNGKPYWMRGANMPPHGLAPNDSALAHRFMRLMHEGNQMATRTHGIPFTQTWADAADREGVGVSVEGPWPWVLSSGSELPAPEAAQHWRDEWLGVVRALRNHPSVLLWTMNNEMFFFHQLDKDPERRAAKWRMLSDLIKATRELDPTRPVVADSAYWRDREDYARNLAPAGIDDGDVDDPHIYVGWYAPSSFHWPIEDWAKRFTGERPVMSQEASTGYPDVDNGKPSWGYATIDRVPQAWVGHYIEQPEVFLHSHAEITQEYIEKIRRFRGPIAGMMFFANNNWFQHCFDADRIRPFPVYERAKRSLAPVLVSLESPQRHFFGGAKWHPRVWVVNDDIEGRDLRDLSVRIQVIDDRGKVLLTQQAPLPDTPYYSNRNADLELTIPAIATGKHVDGRVRLLLHQGKRVIAENTYDVVLADAAWAQTQQTPPPGIALYDPQGRLATTIAQAWPSMQPEALAALAAAAPSKYHFLLADGSSLTVADWQAVTAFAQGGGRVLLFGPGAGLAELMPDIVVGTVKGPMEFVDPVPANDTLFSGLEPLDIRWWNGDEKRGPCVGEFAFRLREGSAARSLANYVAPHSYLRNPEQWPTLTGSPLFEVPITTGKVIISTLFPEAQGDPLATRMLANLLRYLSS